MKVFVNSEPRETPAATVQELAVALDQPAALLLIEHNGIALRRSEWASSRLAEGDRVEILKVAAGG